MPLTPFTIPLCIPPTTGILSTAQPTAPPPTVKSINPSVTLSNVVLSVDNVKIAFELPYVARFNIISPTSPKDNTKLCIGENSVPPPSPALDLIGLTY